MTNILDKTAYFAVGIFFQDVFSREFVASKCLAKNVHKWVIAGQKDRVLIVMLDRPPCSYIQPR